jgi:IS5 family transposase
MKYSAPFGFASVGSSGPLASGSFALAADGNAGIEQCRRPTRRDVFLAKMEPVAPWAVLSSVIAPSNSKAGKGRPSVDLERMLRMYFFNAGLG